MGLFSGRRVRPASTMKMMPKWMEPRNMNRRVSREMVSEPKAAMLRFRVEKPPVAQTLKAWQMASNQLIPASM